MPELPDAVTLKFMPGIIGSSVRNEEQIIVEGIEVEVTRKPIRGMYLRVDRQQGRVRVSAPQGMSGRQIRAFVVSKQRWIRQKQDEIRDTPAESTGECVSGEVHFVWGRGCPLSVVERNAPPAVALREARLVLRVRPGTGPEKRRQILDAWYREKLRTAIPPLLEKWTPLLGVSLSGFYVRRMKTRWGTCNPRRATIRVNTKLATKPPECLEFLVLHELLHLLEPSHNKRFYSLMNHWLPHWRRLRTRLSSNDS